MKNTESQCKQILDFLLTGCTLTTWDAIRHFKCTRISARVHDLRNKGYDIQTEMIRVASGKVAQYSLKRSKA
jgi:hypothetical protein